MRYKCTVSYVGNHYEGWQSQTKGTSIQEKIEEAIEHITQKHIPIIASGRTDAGVNAKAQVFMFDTERDMDPRKWMGAINAYLPDDIHILDVEKKDDIFHARYNVRYKKYTYRINNGMYDVFTKDHAYQYSVPLDYEKMEECIHVFEGTHDFTSFNSSSLEEYPIQVRSIYHVECQKVNDMISLTFIGKGFLRYQVRMMAASIIDVGRGKKTIEDVKKMLEEKSRTVKRHNAPACGLTLEHVDYFEMIALNENIQIREFLKGDTLPCEEWNIVDIEQRIQNNIHPCAYAICTRNNQEMKGCLILKDDQATIYLYDMNDQMYINEIQTQIIHKLNEKNISSYEIQLYDSTKNYLK